MKDYKSQREYYKKNKERISRQHKEYYKKNRNRILKRQQKYKESHLNHIRLLKKKWYRQWRNRALEIIGNKCVVCGFDESIRFHEIHGRIHPRYLYITKHKEDFVAICAKCHRILHGFIKHLKEFKQLIELMDCS